MKRSRIKIFSAFLLTILIVVLVPAAAYAATPSDLVIGNNYTLNSGNILNDDLIIVGGSADLMSGSIVNGNVFLIGGSLNAAGTVNGDITILGGTANLAGTLILNGNLSTAGATVNRDPGAKITGQIYTEKNAPYIFNLPGGIRLTNSGMHPLLRVASFFLRLFLWTLVAMVVGMFIPAQLNRTAQVALSEPLISWGLGLITTVILPVVIILLAITICLIPVAFLGALLLVMAWAFGLIALGYELGKHINSVFKVDWHPAITAGVGTLVLMLILNGLEAIIPCVGWMPKILVGFLGLGAVILTQFGMKPYSSRPAPPIESTGGSLPA